MGTSWNLYSPLASLRASWVFPEVMDVKVGISNWRLRESPLLPGWSVLHGGTPKKPLLKIFAGS